MGADTMEAVHRGAAPASRKRSPASWGRAAADDTKPIELPPADHVTLLHPVGRRGVATIAMRDGKWIERPVPIRDLAQYASAMKGGTDVFVSQQAFFGWRRIAQLAQLGAMYSDIDYKNTRWAGESAHSVANSVLHHLDDEGMPAPSYVMSTGRGLCLVWLHDPVPRQALPRWLAAQRVIQRTLAPYGADPMALDAARLFRLAGTRHSIADAEVRAIWINDLHGSVERWNFETLVDEILPFTRTGLSELRAMRAGRHEGEGSNPRPVNQLSAASYWMTVLSDLQKLRTLRWFGPLPPGHRDSWIFLATVGMSWLAPAPVLPREVTALAAEAGGWAESESRSRLASAIRGAEAAARGERREWQGQAVDPRYKFRAQTIVEWLAITEAEMHEADLRVLISPDVAREHAVQRVIAHRRRAGIQAREAYRADAAERAATARLLRSEGKSWTVVAAAMGLPTADAARMLATRT